MVEKYEGPAPDGTVTETWYRLSRAEVAKLVRKNVFSLEPGKTLQDLVDAEIIANPGMEEMLEEKIVSWGLKIHPIGRG
jgi:hypothetical protein